MLHPILYILLIYDLIKHMKFSLCAIKGVKGVKILPFTA